MMLPPTARSTQATRRTRGILGGRSEQVVRRVFEAASAELAASGYAGLRMDRVAERAAVNKTTIYRRWPSRLALVTALVGEMQAALHQSPLPDTGSLESDLVGAFARRFRVARQVEGRAWARLLAERDTPEVEAIIGRAVNERRGEWLAMVTRAIERAELPRGTEAAMLLDMVRAIVDARIRATGRLDETWLTLAVRTVIVGARAGTLVRNGATRRRRRGHSSRAGRSGSRAPQA